MPGIGGRRRHKKENRKGCPMTCYRPHTAYKALHEKTEKGKACVYFKRPGKGIRYEVISLPCGRCIGCRVDRARSWALRCVHEAERFEKNCFLTLTFNDKWLYREDIRLENKMLVEPNPHGSLVKSDFQKFMKRLRKSYKGYQTVKQNGRLCNPIRYFHCGEYGSQLGRAHHHACVFNFDFPDKEFLKTSNGVKLYASEILNRLWPFGFCVIGDVTYESAAYVASYVVKKINGKKALLHYSRINKDTGELNSIQPEYVTMSRRPGIGRDFMERFANDLYTKDFITHGGKKFKAPAFYDYIYDSVNPVHMEILKKERKEKAKKNKKESTLRRLRSREVVAEKRMERKKRGYENEGRNVLCV